MILCEPLRAMNLCVHTGIVSGFCIALLLYLVRKNPSKAKKIAVGKQAHMLPRSRRRCMCAGIVLVSRSVDFDASVLRRT